MLLGSDGKVPSSLQATDMTLSLDTNTKILTVTVNGTSKTVDLSELSGMKRVTETYTTFSEMKAALRNLPVGAEIYLYNDTMSLYGHHTGNTTYIECNGLAVVDSKVYNIEGLTIGYSGITVYFKGSSTYLSGTTPSFTTSFIYWE